MSMKWKTKQYGPMEVPWVKRKTWEWDRKHFIKEAIYVVKEKPQNRYHKWWNGTKHSCQNGDYIGTQKLC